MVVKEAADWVKDQELLSGGSFVVAGELIKRRMRKRRKASEAAF